MPSWVTTFVALWFIGIGLLHFANRERDPGERSYLVGGVRVGPRARTALALIELFGGFLVLFAATLSR